MTIKEIRMPDGYKDIDELLRAGAKPPAPIPITDVRKDPTPSADELIHNLLGDLKVSTKDAEAFCDPAWVYPNLIIEGHITVIPAEPNGGKTTILWSICPLIIQKGYDVVFVNADISGGDAKPMITEAEQRAMTLLLPDMGKALGMPHVVEQLATLAKSGVRFDNKVFIFDTLKKMIPPNDKGATRRLFQTLRALSAQGMTIVLLAHTLKRYTEEGLPEYEGVGDIRADTDELIYFIPRTEADGTKTVSTLPDKVRGSFEPISFRIAPDRTVIPLQKHVNLKAQKAAEQAFLKDSEDIEEIHEFLLGGSQKQAEIIKRTSLSQHRAVKLLRRYRSKQWAEEVGDKNAKYYRSLPPDRRFPAKQDTPHENV